LPEVTWPAAYQLVASIIVYYAAVNFCAAWAVLGLPRLGPWLLVWGLVGTGVMLSGLALMGVKWAAKVPVLRPLLARLPTVLSETINANVMGGILAVIVSTSIGLLLIGWCGHRWGGRLALLGASLGIVAVLVLTQSRGAWMGFATLAVITGVLVWHLGLDRVAGLLLTSQTVQTVGSRVEIWSRALYMIQDFPFTGIGMGTFRQVANVLYPFFLAGPDAEIPHAHNLFLQVAVDLGLPGLVAWLAVLLLVMVAAWQTYRRGRTCGDHWLAGLGAGLLCSQVALVVHGLTDAVTWGTRPAIIVWAVWGLAMAAYREGDKVTG
jgi:putative inorganic carbon (HCO3(-)) transporter